MRLYNPLAAPLYPSVACSFCFSSSCSVIPRRFPSHVHHSWIRHSLASAAAAAAGPLQLSAQTGCCCGSGYSSAGPDAVAAVADNAVGVSCLPSAAASQPLQLLVAEVEPLDASVSALAAPAETPDPAKACALPALPVTPASAIPASAAAFVLSPAVVPGVSGHSALLPAAAAAAAGVGTAVAAAISAVP